MPYYPLIESLRDSLRANLVEVSSRRIFAAEIYWRDGVITAISELGGEDSGLPYLLPGFVDAHVHIESSMLTPAEFARIAARHGTVAAVSDPHEIANVLGLDGVRFMIDSARQTPFKFCFGAPSCVPATSFETAGARLDCEQLEMLFQTGEASYLSEVMNYPGVLAGDPDILAKLDLARRYGCKIDGHAPGLSGSEAVRYAEAGISTDHECTTLKEAEEKLASGMHILIREGSAARNFEALHPLISLHPDKVMLCSDDKHPDELAAGHIDRLAARALQYGHALFDVLQCASINPVRHYGLPIGQLRPGDRMDAVLVSDLETLTPLKTWLAGRVAAERGKSLLPVVKPKPINRFNARRIQISDLIIKSASQTIRVIQALDGELLTRARVLAPKVSGGNIVADIERDVLMLTVVNRYRPEKPAVAFIQGFGLKQGALASSVAHDSHNIIAVGADAESICRAVNGIIEQQGGIAVVENDRFECLPLPIAGLISDRDGDYVANRYAELDRIAKRIGSPLRTPFMTLSFMALLVIPDLKLSDRGLFDSRTFQFTDLGV
ncbi:adenine deaminase [Methylomicrobium sp. Wu6]|uniref:adenine deaminase n=1 Tax=Methylomicrobium sp. Wu6 TaxID=3107928 RepID=UPI002DD62CA1|nr:adenine deaminase [Methylomicrobium sp. Wu6]MEC4749274.1 adenine deaminase [Methylomicrobium sp. Wu6]